MKLKSDAQTVEMQGAGEATAFSIKGSPKAFQILSSGLYSNKPMAIIRELSCNAVDAHAMNGNQKKQFDIKLPNRLDSQFYVRDYGPGLSDQGIKKLYTTYFDSTKTESNEFIGGLGLGSKSPFSYTDTFTVESIHNGEKRIYAAYIDEQGLPQIRNFGDAVPTTEPSGLKVGFPVQLQDYQRFENEARRVLQFFDPAPNVMGTGAIDTIKPLKASTNVSTYDEIPGWATGWSEKKTFIRMGSVVYPMDWASSGLKDHPLYINFFSKIQKHVVLNMPIGSVEVAASRESLQYDPRTNKQLRESIVTFAEQMLDVIDHEASTILKKHTPFIAQKKIYLLQKEWGFSFELVAKELSKLTTKKYPWLDLLSIKDFPTTTFKTFTVYYQQSGQRQSALLKNGTFMNNQNMTPARLNPSNTTMVVECDTKGHATVTKMMLGDKPTEKYYKDQTYDDAYVIVPMSSKLVGTPEYEAEKELLLNTLGNPTLRKTSEGSHLLQRTTKAGVVAGEVEGVIMSRRTNRYYGAPDKEIVKLKDIETWYPMMGRDQNPVTYFKNDKDELEGHEFDNWTFTTNYKKLSEELKAIGVVLPDTKAVLGVPLKAKKMMSETNIPLIWDVIKEKMQDPKVKKFLATHNRQLDMNMGDGRHDKYRGVQTFLDYVRKNAAQFQKLGTGWKDFLSVQKEPELIGALKYLYRKDDYKNTFGMVEPTRVSVPEIYYNLMKTQPLVGAMMLGHNDAPSPQQAKIHKAIIEYLEANKIDVDIDVGITTP